MFKILSFEPWQILKAIFVYRWSYRVLMLALSLLGTILSLLAPFFQKEFIDSLLHGPQLLHGILGSHGEINSFWFLVTSFALFLISLVCNQTTTYLATREGLLAQRELSALLYAKTLSLRAESLNNRPVGEIVTIYATDIPGSTVLLDQTLPMGMAIFFPLLLAPLFVGLFLDLPLWPIYSLVGIMVVINILLAGRHSDFFFKFKQYAADRVALVSEWIQNIRALRILGWTELFEGRIIHRRVIETDNRLRMVTSGQTMNSISSSVTYFINFLTIAAFVWLSNKSPTGGELLAIFWVLGVLLTRPFRMLPWFFLFVVDGWTSLKRLSDFLKINNREPKFGVLPNFKVSDDLALRVEGLNLMIGDKPLLRDISFSIRKGEFVGIVGEVGSGKSLLFLSLLAETGAWFEHYEIQGKLARNLKGNELRSQFALVAQEGFIMSASLGENVHFEYTGPIKLSEELAASLARAQFQTDLLALEEGLGTRIGERGVNLSGGQKQRVALARVDFHQSPIVLMDDSLSAVDASTEEKLIENLISGHWKSRTRLLISHRLSVLDKVDRVFFMRDGRLLAQGSLNELLSTNEEFRNFVYTQTKSTTAPTSPEELV